MNGMEMMAELAGSGISVTLMAPRSKFNYSARWRVDLEKNSDGVSLSLFAEDTDGEECIRLGYEKWLAATRGMVTHSLLQIEHLPAKTPAEGGTPPATVGEEEIPF